MYYELATKLKEAGFPQTGVDTYSKDNWKLLSDGSGRGMPIDRNLGAYCPTLSELIEACGEFFCRFELQYHPNKHITMDCWWAYARDLKDNTFDIGGQTPEEAVAMLYISLNKDYDVINAKETNKN